MWPFLESICPDIKVCSIWPILSDSVNLTNWKEWTLGAWHCDFLKDSCAKCGVRSAGWCGKPVLRASVARVREHVVGCVSVRMFACVSMC